MISCNEYDYIEIVCMHRYPIKILTVERETIEGFALDTQRNETREECIKIYSQGTEMLVVLTTILRLEVCIENPHFKTVEFK